MSNSAENSLITRPSSIFQPNSPFPRRYNRLETPLNVGSATTVVDKYHPKYSRIVPAPYSSLSSQSGSQNLVDDIFSQSQIRHAPLSGVSSFSNALAPLSGSPFGAPIIPQLTGGSGGNVAGQALLNGLGKF